MHRNPSQVGNTGRAFMSDSEELEARVCSLTLSNPTPPSPTSLTLSFFAVLHTRTHTHRLTHKHTHPDTQTHTRSLSPSALSPVYLYPFHSDGSQSVLDLTVLIPIFNPEALDLLWHPEGESSQLCFTWLPEEILRKNTWLCLANPHKSVSICTGFFFWQVIADRFFRHSSFERKETIPIRIHYLK